MPVTSDGGFHLIDTELLTEEQWKEIQQLYIEGKDEQAKQLFLKYTKQGDDE